MINYNNSIIYKICCKDVNIKEIYIGSTVNMLRIRKGNHKSNCNNERSTKYNIYVYQFIRTNGGWNNWDIIELEKYNCNDKQELHKRERYYIEKLQATLNSDIPTQTKKEYYEKNKEQKKTYDKEYRKENKDKIKEKRKKYYEENKEQIAEKGKQKITCDCGCIISKKYLARHCKSIKHMKYLDKII